MTINENYFPKITVIGLGYVGLPLAVALAKHFDVTGFDIDETRIEELHKGHDRTAELDESTLRSSSLHLTSNVDEISSCDIYIVTVPTPVTNVREPDLKPLTSASTTVGAVMQSGAIVVYESTVYPGVTEDHCAPILEKISGLTCGKDFFLGYSPERINPGDKVHTVDKITKVVAGQNKEVTEKLAYVYGKMNDGNIFKAASIKTAEAAKVIENTQRDINIAFVNELASIFSKLDISVYDVLDAAGTKWNFLNFQPGLVGGHCIGVDPYYLAYAAEKVGVEAKMTLAGRHTNELMGHFIANKVHTHLEKNSRSGARILVLGLTFKENVPDLRNTKVTDVIAALGVLGYDLDVHDPLADCQEAKDLYGIELFTSLDEVAKYDCVIGAVPHTGYCGFNASTFEKLLNPGGLVVDIKRIWHKEIVSSKYDYWTL